MKAANVAEVVKSEKAVSLFGQMYGENRVEENAKRYEMVAEGFAKEFGDREFEFFTAPGRTEESAAIIQTTIMEKFWQEVYIWIVWQQRHPMEQTQLH